MRVGINHTHILFSAYSIEALTQSGRKLLRFSLIAGKLHQTLVMHFVPPKRVSIAYIPLIEFKFIFRFFFHAPSLSLQVLCVAHVSHKYRRYRTRNKTRRNKNVYFFVVKISEEKMKTALHNIQIKNAVVVLVDFDRSNKSTCCRFKLPLLNVRLRLSFCFYSERAAQPYKKQIPME